MSDVDMIEWGLVKVRYAIIDVQDGCLIGLFLEESTAQRFSEICSMVRKENRLAGMKSFDCVRNMLGKKIFQRK